MKGLFAVIFALTAALYLPGIVSAQEGQPTDTGSNAPVAQPLTREGDFAVKLLDALNLGKTDNEAQAEDALSAAGISPKNGWIADYPVTPDVSGEVQASIGAAADSGKLSMNRDEALTAFQGVLSGLNLPVKTAGAEEGTQPPAEENYPDTTEINNYYYTEGPPAVTYYSPPPDYAYLYTWVPYPFWWWNFWYPGFFVLVDFDFDEFDEFHHHHHFSNHFRDPRTGRIARIDPTNRARGGVFTGTRRMGPSAQRGAQSILRRSTGRISPGGRSQYRGFGTTRPSPGTRSSVFQRWGNSRFEGAASSRGYQSRSRAGQIPSRNFAPGRAPSAPRGGFSRGGGGGGGGFQGFHGSGGFGGGGGFSRGGGGGFRR